MKYYTIGPLNHLELVEKSPCHLVVAPFLKGRILNFYRKLKEKGAEIILDNGAFETGKSMDVQEYLKIAKLLKPDIVIVPDVWKRAEATINVTDEFIKAWHSDDVPNSKLMFVPQGNTIEELLDCFTTMRNNYLADFFGLPYRQWDDTSGTVRKFMYEHLMDNKDIKFHLLGLYSLQEIVMAKSHKNVVSCDSSLPFKAASSMIYLSTHRKGSIYQPVLNKFNFYKKFIEPEIRLAKENLILCEGLVH